MNARECVLAVLDHKEPDRIAFDLGGTTVTGIHVTAYKALRDYLGMPVIEIRVDDLIEQLAVIDPDMAERLGTDCRRVSAGPTSTYERIFRDEGNYTAFSDEWGISWRMPKQGGFSFDTYQHPLAEAKSLDDLRDYAWPDPVDRQRFEGLRERAKALHDQGKVVVLAPHCVGPTEMHAFLRGWRQYYLGFVLNPRLVESIMDRVVELKMAFWEHALTEVGEYVDVVMEADDVAG